MKLRHSLFCLALATAAVATAQTETRRFYIDFGQNNVTNQGFLTDTDANGHKWNNIHGKGTGAPDKAYALTSTSMVTASGATTSCKVCIGSTFSTNGYSNGGLNNPSEALLGDMAVQTATQDYIFMEGGQDYGIVRFSGLDKTKGYRFYSFGSRTDTGTPGRVATFEFRGLNRWQGDHTMGAKGIGANGYDGNNNNIQESGIIFPDADGVIEMTIIKKVKNGMVHLNAMKVVELSGVSHPFQQYTLSRKMYFDLGERGKAGSRGDITSSPDANGNYWNNLAAKDNSSSQVAAETKVNVVTSTNAATTIVLNNLTAWNANGVNNGGWNNPSADLLGDLAVAGATQDYMYTENKGYATLQFSGLDKTKRYRFHIFGSRTDAGAIRSTVLRVSGKNQWMSVQTTSGPNTGGQGVNQNAGNIAVSDFIQPDEMGYINFTFRQNENPACNFGHVNVLKVEEWNTNGAADPTPAPVGDQKFYIDFGEYNVGGRGMLTEGADANGNYWTNVYSMPAEKLRPRSFTLVNSQNEATPYSITVGTFFHTNGMSGGGGLAAPDKSLLGDLAVETATNDYIHLEGEQNYSVLHFRGLNPAKGYRFSLFGHRQADDVREGIFRLAGYNVWEGLMQMSGAGIGANGYNGNNNKILMSEPIFPDAQGNITLTAMKTGSNTMVYLNCMKMEEVSGAVRPHQDLSLGQKFYIDFGQKGCATGYPTEGTDVNGNQWNNLMGTNTNAPSQIPAGTTVALKNSAGTSTAASIKLVQMFETNGGGNGGNLEPSAAELGDLAIKTATEDYMFIGNTTDERSILLQGLDKNHCYRIYIYGMRQNSANRIARYVITGQTEFVTGQPTSGYSLGGYGFDGNRYNITSTDYLYPNVDGNIEIKMKALYGMAHISAMKIEEYTGGTRPSDGIDFSSLSLSGNAEDGTFNKVGNSVYELYTRLNAGTFKLQGIVDGTPTTLYNTGEGQFGTEGSNTNFTVQTDCVARITVNSFTQTITVLPVTMNVRGNIGAGNPAIAYKGAGVFQGQVTLQETASQQWVDKTMWFALNNNDAFAIKRHKGNANRYKLGETEKGETVENIYQNAGTYTITVDMVNKVYDIQKDIDENRISVFGSSVANGQGATDFKGYRYLEGQNLLARYNNGESNTPFYTANVSIGGNKTTDLLGRYDDLTRDFGRYVIFGLSLGNEGIHGAGNQEAIFNQWRDNMLTLIARAKAEGKIPMVMNNYTRSDYNESDYSYVKRLNLLIHEWDVASTNCLGSIDDGTGKWANGYRFDDYHQNTAGHYEFFYSIVPSLFDAIKAGKAQPTRNTTKSMTLEAGKYLTFAPEGTAHPFTLSLRVKGTAGQLFTVNTSEGKATVSINAEGKVVLTTASGATNTSTKAINDGQWHYVTLTSYYAAQRTLLYVDKTKAFEVATRMGGIGLIAVGDAANSRQMSELSFWRSGMTPEEISAHCDGRMLKSSLELYAPLGGTTDCQNLAQSLNKLTLATAPTAKFVKSINTQKVVFTAETGSDGFSADQNFHSLFDGTTNKWCLNLNAGTPDYVVFHANRPVSLSGYKITTGADCATWTGRNPKAWKLYGSTAAAGINADDASWEEIASVDNDTQLQDVNSVTYDYALGGTTKMYTSFKWVISERKGSGNGVLQVEEFTPVVASALPQTPVTITIDEGTRGWGDEVEKILDDDTHTKWNCWMQNGRAYAIMHTSQPIHIEGYEITTGNDNASWNNRNPKDWVLYASPLSTKPDVDDPSWEPIYRVKDDAQLQDLNEVTYQYKDLIPSRRAYQYYKWEITATQGDMVQVGEFNLYAYEERGIGSVDQLTITDAGWATYTTPFATDFTQTADIAAYLAIGVSEDDQYVRLDPVTKVEEGTAVLVKGPAGVYTIHATAEETLDDTSGNLLHITTANMCVPEALSYYILSKKDDKVGFRAAKQNTYIPADRGYLYLPQGSNINFFYFDEEGTSIGGVNADVNNDENLRIYNLAGQRISRLQRGVNIVGGKKILY